MSTRLLTTADMPGERAESGQRKHAGLRTAAVYVVTIVFCLLAVFFVMDLQDADLSVPLYMGHDANSIAMGVKNLLGTGSMYTNRFLGAPGQLELYDFPFFYGFDHVLVLKVLSLASVNYALVMNLYFLLSFPLAAVSSLFVLRRFGISDPAAVLASLLFAMLPYHFIRGENHFFLALYFLVPLAVMVALWVATGEPLFRFRPEAGQSFVTGKGAAALAICALMTVDNVYYAFFGAWLLVVAAVLAWFRHGRRGAMVASVAILLVVVGMTFALCLLPNFNYFHHHGGNPTAAPRIPPQSELYGLKMAQLIFPVTGHRISLFSDFKRDYNGSPLVNENDSASLGAIASCGFLLLLGWVLVGHGRSRAAELLGVLSGLNLAAFLLGTIGGLGALFAWVISPEIRSLNRISVFIAFLSLFAVAVVADHVGGLLRGRAGKIAWYCGIVALMAVGVFDQTTEAYAPRHREIQAQFAHDADFVKQIEGVVPANGMIFQLPYMPFPENVPIYKLTDYDHLLGYLHSRSLRWSYAAMRGRETDSWEREIADKPTDEMIDALVYAGFSGIYVDRSGYGDKGASLEEQLGQRLGVEAIRSSDGRLFFYSLEKAEARLRAKHSNGEWQAMHDAALSLPAVSATWEPSCWPLEGTPEENGRWCPERGRLYVFNRTSAPKKVMLEMSISTGFGEPAKMQLLTPGEILEMKTNADGKPSQLSVTVPPGEHWFEFRHEPSDWKTMSFQVKNFRYRDLP